MEEDTRPVRGGSLRSLRSRINKDPILAALYRGGSAALFVTVSGSLLSIVVQLTLARSLPPAEYGLYVFLLACLNFLRPFAKLELDEVAVRYVGEFRATGRFSLIHGFVRRAHQIVIAASLVLALIAALTATLLARHALAGNLIPALVVAAILPFHALIFLHAGTLRGFRRILHSGLPNQLIRPFVFVVLLGLLLATGWLTLSVTAAVGLNLVANLVALGFSIMLLRRALKEDLPEAKPEYSTRTWVKVGCSFLLITLLHVVLSMQADVFLIGVLLDMEGAAVYSIASQLSLPLMLVLNAIQMIASPLISELHASGRRADLQRMVRAAVWAGVAVATPIVVAIFLFGHSILQMIGTAYAGGYWILVVLTTSYAIVALGGGIAGYLMTMTGHHREAVRFTGWSALVNIAATVSLLPSLGPLGAAIGTAVAFLVRLSLLAWFIRKKLGVSVIPFVPAPKHLIGSSS